jgi:hypothetical protein
MLSNESQGIATAAAAAAYSRAATRQPTLAQLHSFAKVSDSLLHNTLRQLQQHSA